MKFLKSALVIASTLLACSAFAASKPATPAQIELIRAAMQDKLKDADSAKFKNVRFVEGIVVCGEVNSKNSYGAYSGFTVFMGGITSGGNAIIIGIDSDGGAPSSALACAETESKQQSAG